MFVVCGEALWDLFAAESDDGLSFDARIGGSPLNVAIGLCRLGQTSALVTGLSTDRLGERIFDVLEREGVNTDLLVRMPNLTTLSLVDVAADGAPAYAFYGQGAADRSVVPGDLPELPADAWGVHAGSYSLAVEPTGSSLLAMMRREAGRRLLTLDPNVRLNVEPDVPHWRKRIEEFIAHANLVKASDEDLSLLYPGAGRDRIAQEWLDGGASAVIFTLGPAGAEAFGPFGRVSSPAVTVDMVDSVGAGDTFQAALITGLAERGATSPGRLRTLGSEDMAGLLDFANRAAAITCGRRGADLPTRADVDAFRSPHR